MRAKTRRGFMFYVISFLFFFMFIITLLGATAPWLNVEDISIIQLIPSGILILTFLNLLALFYFLRKSGKGVVFAMIALFICGWILMKDLHWGKKSAMLGDVKVVSFNVGSFDFKPAKIDAAAELLKRLDPDIIAFQEFRNHKLPDGVYALDYMARALEMSNYEFVHLPVHIHGAAIYSKYPILELDTLFMPPKEINSGILTTLKTPVGKIGIGNMHLSSYQVAKTLNDEKSWGNKISAVHRRAKEVLKLQQDKVDQVLNKTSSYPYPLVLTGDLNSPPHSRIVNQFSRRFQDSFLIAGKGAGWTFPVLGPLGIRIDYQFASYEWTIVDHKVIDSNVSDHNPVMVTYSLVP